MTETVRVVNYGGGTNSTALLVFAVLREIPIHIIPFADTGSERPITYEYIDVMNTFLRQHGYPEITTVKWHRVQGKYPGRFLPLHEWCELEGTVPSRAFGLSGCTNKWKQMPIDRFLKKHPLVLSEHEAGRPVVRWIGYDADEPSRAERMLSKNPEPDWWKWECPLVPLDMGREECLEIIAEAGLPQPGKSSCWMCPSMRKVEIDELGRDHPELLERALKMERNAEFRTRNGLGGSLNWNEYVDSKRKLTVVKDVPESSFADQACGCYDG
jgi:hypothetical protein